MRTCCQDEALCTRFGGEEFLIVLPGKDETAGVEMAERLRTQVANHQFTGVPWSLSASFGITQICQSDTEKMLVKRADEHLYAAKENGRNRCCCSSC